MGTRTAVLAALALLGALACNATGPQEFPHAVATMSCGPADGAATQIFLAQAPIEGLEPSFPFISLSITRSLPNIVGTWPVNPTSLDAYAGYITGPATSEAATSGTITIRRGGTGSGVEGSVELVFPSRRVVENFSAPWIERFIICG